MNKFNFLVLIIFFSIVPVVTLKAQNKIPFGRISFEDLENKPYKPDPGADAIILSDEGTASLKYNGNEFYVELVRDVKIRIVNSRGFDYANIELPFSSRDIIKNYRASTFNIRSGEILETSIPKKDFIIDNTSKRTKALKFNFPDVREGSVLEYSYTVLLKNYAVNILVPWEFQADIPVVKSMLTVSYPEYFIYKTIISGSALSVVNTPSYRTSVFHKQNVRTNVNIYHVEDMPAFREEPYIKSKNDCLTKINFELAAVSFPGSSLERINPTYETLSDELLKRSDFGQAMAKTGFLKKDALKLSSGLSGDIEKVKKIHEFISGKILWNGVEDFMTSAPLKKIYFKEKGNSADINLMLIGMLRLAGIKADPVILSTRSNGSINPYSAMIRQFNYVLAYVYADGQYFLVDATDPLRPFNVLPFECLNDAGRLIAGSSSRFVDLKNSEKNGTSTVINLVMDDDACMSGEIKTHYSDFSAYNIRKQVMIEGREGYLDHLKSSYTELEINDFSLENLEARDLDVIETININIINAVQKAGESYLFNPFLSAVSGKSAFWQETRNFPIDFGAPVEDRIVVKITVPSTYSVVEKPAGTVTSLGKGDGSYEFRCETSGNEILISSHLKIDNTFFEASEYSRIREYYSGILQKQAELIVMSKNEE